MRRTLFLFVTGFFFLIFTVSACNSGWFILPTATPTLPTVTPSETPEPTQTRVWFPATATNTPLPGNAARTATPDLRPLNNEVILRDDFGDRSSWEQYISEGMSASYGVNEFTIALKNTKGSLYSFNVNPMPNDYFLEIEIEPSLCSGTDQFGLVFRTQSNQEFYRLMMGCDGQITLDLVRSGSGARLDETQQSAQVFSGPEAKVKLNIWLVDDGVQIFINDVLQVEYYQLQWLSGGIGVFGRSSGEYALTVSFSDLIFRSTDPIPATPVPSLTATPD